jgi:pescadillo protein
VDFRILLTFLDLYRTMTSFVLFKLYTDENLVYPPQLDVKLDEAGQGVGKFKLVERAPQVEAAEVEAKDGKKITKKDVKKGIRSIAQTGAHAGMEVEDEVPEVKEEQDEEFVHHPSKNEDAADPANAPLPTYTSLLANTASDDTTTSNTSYTLFSPYTFYLSRETSSRTWEFVIRAFGGKVVTGDAIATLDPTVAASITHILLDRPMEPAAMRKLQGDHKWTWVQPQWVADCANLRRLLPAGEGSGYEPGGTLPPHVSPWDNEGANDRPWLGVEARAAVEDEESADEEMAGVEDETLDTPAMRAAAADPTDSTLVHQAELEAEASGVDHAAFKKHLAQLSKARAIGPADTKRNKKPLDEEDQRKIMMTGKKSRLYEKMQYSNNERRQEVSRASGRSFGVGS